MPPRVTVLGPLPPPFGGVSIHIIRFLDLLRSEGFDARGFSYTGTTYMTRWGKVKQAVAMMLAIYLKARPDRNGVLHLHYGGMGYFLAAAPVILANWGRKVITFHSVRVVQDLSQRPGWLRRFALNLLGRFDLFVCVREGIGTELRALGLTDAEITIMPAFLPPAESETGLDRLPEDVQAPLQAAQSAGRRQICCAAYYLGAGYGQDDLYGLEALADALAGVGSPATSHLDLWVMVSNRPETAAQKEAEARLTDRLSGLDGLHLHLCYGVPLVPVMARCSGFLRPSREDGDSVAIREAQSLGLPVLASDVVARPEGVDTFSLSGGGDFGRALSAWLEGLVPVDRDRPRTILAAERGRFRQFVHEVVGSEGQASAR